MKKTRIWLWSELPINCRSPHLINKGLARIAEKTILGQGFIPENFLEVVERRLRRKLNRFHRRYQIEQRGETSRLGLLQVLVVGLPLCIGAAEGDEICHDGIGCLQDIPRRKLEG